MSGLTTLVGKDGPERVCRTCLHQYRKLPRVAGAKSSWATGTLVRDSQVELDRVTEGCSRLLVRSKGFLLVLNGMAEFITPFCNGYTEVTTFEFALRDSISKLHHYLLSHKEGSTDLFYNTSLVAKLQGQATTTLSTIKQVAAFLADFFRRFGGEEEGEEAHKKML